MLIRSNAEAGLDALDAELGSAQDATPELLAKVISGACGRGAARSGVAQSARIKRLMAAEAWTETALALIELELPHWKLRRLIFDDGSWLCSLSRQWKLPDWLDDTIDVRHESMPLAILGALILARRREGKVVARPASSVPRSPIELPSDAMVCCDNFG